MARICPVTHYMPPHRGGVERVAQQLSHWYVTLTYTCADSTGPAPSGIASCPAITTISATQAAFTATATDKAGNIGSVPVGAINIDKTPPTFTATATASGVAYSGTIRTSQTVTVTFACGADGAPVTCPAPRSYSAPGTYTATGIATAAGNTATASFGPFTILSTQPSTLTITSLPRLPQGATTVTAKLVGRGAVPIAGRTVRFTAGAVAAMGVTNASGIATATLALKPGLYTLTAVFTGDSAYLASSARSLLVVFNTRDD